MASESPNSPPSIAELQRQATLKLNRRRSVKRDEAEFRQRSLQQTLNASEKEGDSVSLDSWKDSKLVKSCGICKKGFSITNRKHHCRQCGGVYCGKCSSYKLVITGLLKRACLNCYQGVVMSPENRQTLAFKNNAHTFKNFLREEESIARDPGSSIQREYAASSFLKPIAENLTAANEGNDIEFPSWAEAIMIITRVDAKEPTLCLFPEDAFADNFTAELVRNSLPPLAKDGKSRELKYIFRQRDKWRDAASIGNLASGAYYYCYVSYIEKEIQNSNGRVWRRSIVLISRWPFRQLATRLLSALEEVFGANSRPTKDLIEGNDLTSPAITNVIMSAFGQIMLWSTPQPDSTMYLPFLGEMIHYQVSNDIWMTIQGGITLLPSQWTMNLVALLGPFGLLAHTWLLWELVVTGQDILVYSSSPSHCGNIAIAIATILDPLGFLGDIRPHITIADSDVELIRQKSMKDSELRQTSGHKISTRELRKMSKIVGTSDASVVERLEVFGAVIFLSSPIPASSDVDNIYLGMREKNAAELCVKEGTYLDFLRVWQGENGKRKSQIMYSSDISALAQVKVLKKIKTMSMKDKKVIGEKLLRDNLRTLTLSYYKPAADLSPQEEDLREAQAQKQRYLQALAVVEAPVKPRALGVIGYIDDIAEFLTTLPDVITDDIPTVILWICYVFGFLILLGVGAPWFIIIPAVFFLQLPEKAPKEFEEFLKDRIPDHILYPKKPTAVAAIVEERPIVELTQAGAPVGQLAKVDLSGVWKRYKCINYENFLGAQGIGYVQRRLAANISMVHTITMDSQLSAFRLQERGGPLDTDVLYEINKNVEKATIVGKKEFVDKVFWDDKNVLTVSKVLSPGKEYELTVQRYLEDDGKTIRLVGTYKDLKQASSPTIETTCYFEKTGLSPHSPPKSIVKESKGAAIAASVTPVKKHVDRPDFSGIWNRTKSVNFDSFVGVQGAGFVQRKLAAAMPLIHTISMDSERRALRLKEAGGPLNIDNTYTMGNDFIKTTILKNTFKDKAYWNGTSIIIQRVVDDGTFELIMTRSLEDDGNQIVLTSLHRDLTTMVETVATSWFSKTGPTNIDPPKPIILSPDAIIDIDDVNHDATKDDDDDDNDNDDDTAALVKHNLRSISRATMSVSSSAINLTLHQSLKAAAYVNLSGTWERTDSKTSNSSALSGKSSQVSLRIVHVIAMEGNPLSRVAIKEIVGPETISDSRFMVDADAVINKVQGKSYLEKIYLEGKALVQHRLHESQDFEIISKRYLEDGGKTLRLVSIYRNNLTGDESESMSLFRKVSDK